MYWQVLPICPLKVEEPNLFYKYAKANSQDSSKVGPLLYDGKSISDKKEMAEILLKQYSSVLRKPFDVINDEFIDELINEECIGPQLDDIAVDEEIVRKAVNELRDNAAAGSDGLIADCFKKSCYNEKLCSFQVLTLYQLLKSSYLFDH